MAGNSRTKHPVGTTKDSVFIVAVKYALGDAAAGATACCTGSILSGTDMQMTMSGTSPGLQTFTLGSANSYTSVLGVIPPVLSSPVAGIRGKYDVRVVSYDGASVVLEHISGSDYSAAPLAAAAYNVPGNSVTGSFGLIVSTTGRKV